MSANDEENVDTKTLLVLMKNQMKMQNEHQKQMSDLLTTIAKGLNFVPTAAGEPTTSIQLKTQAQKDLELISKLSPRIQKFVFDPETTTFPSWYERNGEILTTDGAGLWFIRTVESTTVARKAG